MSRKIILFSFVALTIFLVYLFRDFLKQHLVIFTLICPEKEINVLSGNLMDRMTYDVIRQSQIVGIKAAKNYSELTKREKLVKVESDKFIIDHLSHSYPFLTLNTFKLLEEIAVKFQQKLKGTNLEGAKFFVSSLTRTEESLKRLRGVNKNAMDNSTHLYGTAFDLAYTRFSVGFHKLKSCHIHLLRETLASVILEMKSQKKCKALKEYGEKCFHIVSLL